jgi:two-component system sensor histidine kinase BaeS
VLNLLVNAYKYTGDRKQITVAARDTEEGVSITVEDDGIGMTAKEMQRIFQPFYRAEKKQAGATGGTGLGLAISRHLVERHGGTLSAASQSGAGSVFTIRLPGVTP